MCLPVLLLTLWLPSGHIWCYAFVLLSSSAAASHARLLELGSSQSYSYTSTVLLNEAEDIGKAVGYQLAGDVAVSVVWESGVTKLLQIELTSPRLLIQSRKAPEPEGFVEHKSQLQGFSNAPFLATWSQGAVSSVYIAEKEDASLKNIKKGIASLFQFRLMDGETRETDASGSCLVVYHSHDPTTILKKKRECLAKEGVPYIRQQDPVLNTNVTSVRTAVITLSRDLSTLEGVTSEERHVMAVSVKPDAGMSVLAVQKLKATDKSVKVKMLKSGDLPSALKEFQKGAKITTQEDNLNPEITRQSCSKAECPGLPALVKELRDHLQDEQVGTAKSANSFIKLLEAGRRATKEELSKSFKGAKNKEIILQLCDLAGSIHTLEAHEIIKKLVNFESEDDLDKTERYLWALSVAAHPKLEIIKDLFKISQRPSNIPKAAATILQTVAAMTRKFRELPGNSENPIVKDVTSAIIVELEGCKDEECKHRSLRALRNLLCPTTIPTLLVHALNGKSATSVEAMKTLRSFKSSYWDDKVIDVSQRIYYQAGRRYDSSARTLAIDILLESSCKREIFEELVTSLLEPDTMFEVKQYLNQRLQQISSVNNKFSDELKSILDKLKDSFRNYNVRAQRGLTTAFTRNFANDSGWSGSLVNIQEVSGGLLKRGIVDIVLSTENNSSSIFTLGLFAGGLGSFVSSSKKASEEEKEEEEATAGMELIVMGTHIRPFVFFSGKGELMSHVWSGTASEKTAAFQALVMTHDHLEYISLQNGLVAQLQLHGVVSFDLSGQIQISLWNRNAHSLVEQNAGVSLQGRAQVDTSFVKSQIANNVATDVKLNLISDLNFYGGVSLCMQLVQPDATLKHSVHKVERIIGSKHRLRKAKYTSSILPGKTYMLNQKNNEMCNNIFTT